MRALKSLLIVAVVCLFAVLTLNVSQLEAKTINLTYATFFPPTHIQAQLAVEWGNEIEKRTNGKVKFSHFAGGALLKGPQIWDGVIKGIADVGMSVLAYTRGRFPSSEAIDLPMGYPNAVAATKIFNDFYNKYKFKEFGEVEVMYLFAHGPGILHSKKPVNNLEDLKGLKIRSTGTSAAVTKALGAVPVSMPQGATYEALQKGVVEATWVPVEAMKGWKQGEVIKYTIECQSIGYSQGFFVAMNKKKWNSLPEDVQKVFKEVSEEWITKTANSWDQSDEGGREFCRSLGNEFIQLSDQESKRWVEAVQPVFEAHIKATEEKGLPGREYVEFIQSEIAKYK